VFTTTITTNPIAPTAETIFTSTIGVLFAVSKAVAAGRGSVSVRSGRCSIGAENVLSKRAIGARGH